LAIGVVVPIPSVLAVIFTPVPNMTVFAEIKVDATSIVVDTDVTLLIEITLVEFATIELTFNTFVSNVLPTTVEAFMVDPVVVYNDNVLPIMVENDIVDTYNELITSVLPFTFDIIF
jgi:hypothetical protein